MFGHLEAPTQRGESPSRMRVFGKASDQRLLEGLWVIQVVALLEQ